MLRAWRERRRLTQLDLALAADVSTRHISYVETGRSKPSRELVLHLAEHLEVPLRERNSLLLAAGYAPGYHETPLDAPEMAPVRDALDKIVAGHEPFPALIFDRRWDLVSANTSASSLMSDGVAPHLLEPPVNVLRVSLHPDGVAPRIVNLGEWAGHLMERLDRQIAVSRDSDLIALAEELRTFPGVSDQVEAVHHSPTAMLFVPLVLRGPGRADLRFFSTVATFGTALDITLTELSIESFFPADEPTAEALQRGPR